MYVCLYLYVYLFYCVYCVPCTANRKPVCHFTCGLLTFTEARRDGTSDNSAPPAPGLQARRRIPWGRAMPVPPPLPRGIPAAQRLSVRLREPRPVDAACTVRTPTRWRRRRMCMPCRCMPNPPLATGNRTRHVCAADSLQTIANSRQQNHPPWDDSLLPGRASSHANARLYQKSSRRGRLAPDLSHHRTCGSAYGGSVRLTKFQVTRKQTFQPFRFPVGSRKGIVCVTGHFPRTTA